MVRRGRRPGLVTGYVVGAGGASLAALSLITGSFLVFLVGTLLMGFANAANLLSRYTAADMAPLSRRASAIGTVVWGATIGAILGPNMVPFAGRWRPPWGCRRSPGRTSRWCSSWAPQRCCPRWRLRPDPYELADHTEPEPPSGPAPAPPPGRCCAGPRSRSRWSRSSSGQFVMTLIMTMTPLHMTEHGHDIAAWASCCRAHTFGMFALSPVSGRLTDRYRQPAHDPRWA